MNKKFSIVFIVVFSAVILTAGVYFLKEQGGQLPNKIQQIIANNFSTTSDVVFVVNNGQELKNYKFDFIASSTVFSVLQEIGQKNNFEIKHKVYPEMGVLVEEIGGVANGANDRYWQYWVNDKLGEVASDKKFLKPGDKVEWKFDTAPAF